MGVKQDKKRQAIQDWAVRNGWILQRQSYLKVINGKKYRLKFQDISVRKEYYVSDIKQWVRLASAYYKDISISDQDQLIGLSR